MHKDHLPPDLQFTLLPTDLCPRFPEMGLQGGGGGGLLCVDNVLYLKTYKFQLILFFKAFNFHIRAQYYLVAFNFLPTLCF